MRTELKLESVVKHGVGGPEAHALELIYISLLHEFKQDIYKYINITQVDDDLEEFVMLKPNSEIYCNIRYPVYDDFEAKSVNERNTIRLDVIHTGLLRIAQYDNQLNVNQLEAIKQRILKENFSFDIICRVYPNKKNGLMLANLIVHPEIDKFHFYIEIENNKNSICKIPLYCGRSVVYFGDDFFRYGKWKGQNELLIQGKRKEVEIRIVVDECKAEFNNLTPFSKPPWFTLMRADITEKDREKATKDFEYSISPAIAAIIREADN